MYNAQHNSGVSPVIGVILMVAVTVALIALVTATVFDLGSDVSESPDATVQFDETDSTISAEVLRNENVGSLKLIAPNGNEIGAASAVGDSIKDSNKQTGNYQIVAEMPDGNEEVLTITSIESTSALNMSGTVSINPAIQGATVKAVDSNSNVIGSATTDSNGEYTIFNDPANADKIIVSVEGFSSGATSNPLYTSTSVPANSETVNIDFDETSTFDYTVGGSSATIVYNGSGTSSDPYKVGNTRQLQAMNNDLDAHYVLGQDIDASNTAQWNNGSGFDPVGDDINEFTGSLDGDGYVIDGLYINRSSTRYVGLIGYSDSGEVRDIGVVNADVSGNDNVGGLIGDNLDGIVSESYATGDVSGSMAVGGLIGSNNLGNVSDSYSTGNVSGGNEVSGLIGYHFGDLSESYATGDVSGGDEVGGLIGSIGSSGDLSESYATGDVSGGDEVGGLAGFVKGDIEKSYATGDVSGNSKVGGLAGILDTGKTSESYATGSVSGNDNVGGLVGGTDPFDFAEVTSSYWDTVSSGQDSSAGGTGLATSDMQGDSYNTDFKSDIVDNSSFTGITGDYPELAWQSE